MKYEIIVPHYNSVESIKRLLESIPNRSDIQITIVDDLSDNNAFMLLEQLIGCSELNVRLFRNVSGIKGAGTCRNIGLQYAKAEYFIFADADDFFVDHAFTKIDENVQLSPNADVIYFTPTSQCLVDGGLSDRHLDYENLVNRYLDQKDNALRYEFFVPWSKVIKSSLVQDNDLKFDEVIASNDVMFSLKVGHLASQVIATKDSMYCVTRGKGTLTVNRSKLVLNSRFQVQVRRLKYLKEHDLPSANISVLDLIRDNTSILNGKKILRCCQLCFEGSISMFPPSYVEYIVNPKRLIQRLSASKNKKDQSFSHQKYQE